MPIIGWEWRSERITAVAPAGYEADPAVTAAIHSFDPGVIPIWRISVYRAPNEDLFRQFVHHGIGRHYPFFTHVRKPFQVDMPVGSGPQDEPNFLDCIFEDVDSKGYLRSGPGDFMPWSWWTYKFCRINWERITQAAWDKRIEKRKAREAKMHADWKEELEYRKAQIQPFIDKKLSKLSAADWRQYAEHQAERDKAIREGRKPPTYRTSPKKVSVALGGRSPRSPFDTYARVAPSGSEA